MGVLEDVIDTSISETVKKLAQPLIDTQNKHIITSYVLGLSHAKSFIEADLNNVHRGLAKIQELIDVRKELKKEKK